MELTPVLHVGFDQYILTNQILFIVDYKPTTIRRLVKTARERNDLSVIDLSKGRKSLSLVGLKGDRFVISAIPRKALCNRLFLKEDD